MISDKIKKIIGFGGAIIVLIFGTIAMVLEPYNEQWYIGMVFVIISIVYFIFWGYLKNEKYPLEDNNRQT